MHYKTILVWRLKLILKFTGWHTKPELFSKPMESFETHRKGDGKEFSHKFILVYLKYLFCTATNTFYNYFHTASFQKTTVLRLAFCSCFDLQIFPLDICWIQSLPSISYHISFSNTWNPLDQSWLPFRKASHQTQHLLLKEKTHQHN